MGSEFMKTGWLDTNGHLHECSEYSHMSKAHELQLANNYPDIRDRTGRFVYGDDVLLEHGWVYIGYSSCCILGSPEWRINWKYGLHLSPAQKEFLEPYFEEKNVSQISRELWDDELLR